MQTKRLHAILDREAALLGGDARRICIGGTAQGGSIASLAAVSYPAEVGALICCRSAFLPRFMKLKPRNPERPVPIFIFAGDKDQVHPWEEMRTSYGCLTADGGYTIEWHIEPDLGHTTESLNEQRYVAYWAARASLGTKKAFNTSAVDALRRLLITKKEPRPPTPRSRAVSARAQRPRNSMPFTHSKAASARIMEEGFPGQRIHPLLKEPEWRMRPQSGGGLRARDGMPEWDGRPLGGLGPPQLVTAMNERREQLEALHRGSDQVSPQE